LKNLVQKPIKWLNLATGQTISTSTSNHTVKSINK
jgi:hypothetical protein